MIPENKQKAVEKALLTAFGVTEFEDIREMTAGLSSALIFRIVVQSKAYLLRIITRTDAIADPSHWYASMAAAADASVAPKVWYLDNEDRVSITDFIEAKPFPIKEARLKLPALLSRLHALPPFPARISYTDMISGFIKQFRAGEMMPANLTDELFLAFEKIKSIFPNNAEDIVACHNDLKPENIIYDGERPWIVDWEAAFLNNRYFDLGIIANFVVKNEQDEKAYLKAYFGREATEQERARFYLMRQMMHVSYFTSFILFGKQPGETIDINTSRPGFHEFHDKVWNGELSMADMGNRIKYAMVHMDQLRENLRSERFAEAMAIIVG